MSCALDQAGLAAGHWHWLDIPDVLCVLIDGTVRRELATACCVQDTSSGPFILVGIHLPQSRNLQKQPKQIASTLGSDVLSAQAACALNANRTAIDTERAVKLTVVGGTDTHCTDLVHLLLSLHVAGKIICNQEPVIALGHVVDIVHQILEVLSISKCAVSDPAGTQCSQDQVSDDCVQLRHVQCCTMVLQSALQKQAWT